MLTFTFIEFFGVLYQFTEMDVLILFYTSGMSQASSDRTRRQRSTFCLVLQQVLQNYEKNSKFEYA